MKGYTCACGKEHKFDVWALAHQHITLTHVCECERKNTIRRGVVLGTARPLRGARDE